MSQLWLVVLVVVAAAGIWLGFAEDFEIGMVVALVALVAATLYAFHTDAAKQWTSTHWLGP